MDPIEISHVRGTDPVACELLAAMEAEITGIYGPVTPDRTSTVGPEEMAPPGGVYVVLREGGRVVAGGGVRRLEDGVGEIKRMYVVPEARGRGHGRRLLEALEAAAGDYNGNSYATYWGEKALSRRRARPRPPRPGRRAGRG